MSQTIDLSVIIVSWNVRELLAACLTSVESGRGGLQLQTIVVDSGSSDGTPEMVREQFPQFTLIARTDNVGFPKGNNLGMAAAKGRHILLLNPDTIVIGNALPTLVTYLDQNPSVGIVAPQLLNPDGSLQSSRRRFPTLATGMVESSWLEPYVPQAILTKYYCLDQADDKTQQVDWATGAALMARSEAAAQVGDMDEAYFMYSEELDWCKRFKIAGWQIVYLPAAQITHYAGKSSEQAVTARHINFNRAKLRYFRKYHGRAAAAILRLTLLLNFLWQLGLELGKGVVGHKRELRWQRVRSYWATLRSGLRPAGY